MESKGKSCMYCTVLRGRGKRKHHSSLAPLSCTTVPHLIQEQVLLFPSYESISHLMQWGIKRCCYSLSTHICSHIFPFLFSAQKNHLRCGDGGNPPQRKIVGIFFLRRSSLSSGGKEERASVGWGKPRERERERKRSIWGGGERSTQESKRKALEKAGKRKKAGFRSSVGGCVLQWSLAPEVGGGEGKEYQAFPSLHDAPLAQ